MSATETTTPAASLDVLAATRRITNYLAAAQVYLKSNALLREPLAPEHVKSRLLGHWGTCPGINLVYAHVNRLVKETGQRVLLVTGPGHGAAANLANLWLEGSLEELSPVGGHERDPVATGARLRLLLDGIAERHDLVALGKLCEVGQVHHLGDETGADDAHPEA